MKKIILFELNEVPFKIIDYYCAKKPSSALAQFVQLSSQFTTENTDQGELSPWITWPTFHRGVTNKTHGIQYINQPVQEIDRKLPPLWKILKSNGLKVGVGGSLGSDPAPEENLNEYSFYLPDTFATSARAYPQALSVFQDFNLAMVKRSGRNVSRGIEMGPGARLMAHLPQTGITIGSLWSVGRHLVTEMVDPIKKNRRRAFQALLAFDVCLGQIQKSKPDFSTIFTNHVASSMHRFWGATFPGDYSHFELTQEWCDTYSGEIDFALDMTSEMLGRLKRFADLNPEYQILVASSMGQAATEAKHRTGYLTITDMKKFMTALGIAKDWEMEMAMAPDFSVKIKPELRDQILRSLRQLSIFSLMKVEFKEPHFLHISMLITDFEKSQKIGLNGKNYEMSELGLGILQDEERVGVTAYHIPQGILLAYDPQQTSKTNQRREIYDSTSLAPAILENFSIRPPDYMTKQKPALNH